MRLRAGSHWLFPLMLATAVIMGPLLSAGCGGGSSSSPPKPTPTPTPTGSGSPTPTPTPTPTSPQTVTGKVVWAARARQQTTTGEVSGPSSALSVTFVVRGAASGGGDVNFGGDRDPKFGSGGTQDYNSGSQKALPGIYPVSVRFYAQTGAQGTLVGTADTSATVQADGSLSATFSTFTTITAVDIPADQILNIGQTKVLNSVSGENNLLYTPKDEKGNVVAISPGSATLTLVNSDSTVPGQPSASLQGDSITGLAPQRATVRVSVDYKSSPETAVLVRSNAQVSVSPDSSNLSLLEQQQFTATVANDNPTTSGVVWSVLEGDTNGTIDQNGLFKATRNEGTFTVRAVSKYDPNVFADRKVTVASAVAVAITPSDPQNVSFKGGQVQYRATVSRVPQGEDDGVTWSVDGGDANGTISADGLYTAPNTSGQFTVRATSKFDNRKVAAVTVNVQSLVNIAISAPNPLPTTVPLKTTVNFAATVTGVAGGGDTGVDWAVSANGGSITPAGVYQAPSAPVAGVTVTATSRFDPGKTASVTFDVNNPQVITVTPNPANLSIKEVKTLLLTVDNTPAGQDAGVVWSVEGGDANGTITQAGVYTAPARVTAPGQPIRIIVASKYYSNNPNPYVVLVNTSDNTAITVDPDPARVAFRATQLFSATVTGVPAGGDTGVTWKVADTSFGTIDANTGVYTAKAKPGQTQIIATSKFSGKTKSVNVTIATGITTITVDPDGTQTNPVKLPINAQRQFTATVNGVPDGQDTGVTWTVEGGGTITQTGVYTAPGARQDALVKISATSKYDPTFPPKVVYVKIESGNIDVIVN